MRKVLNNQLPLASRRRHTKFFFFIGSQKRFHLLIYTPWAQQLTRDLEETCYQIQTHAKIDGRISQQSESRWIKIGRVITIRIAESNNLG